MNQSTFRTIAACLVTVALAAYSWTAHGQDIERSFAVDEGDRVVVDVERAEITVSAWDRPEVSFSAVQTGRLEFEFSQDDGVVTIRGRDEGSNGLFGWFSRGPTAEITMNVPYRQNLNLRTRGGDITLDRLQGELSARTSGGDLEAGDIDGPVEMETSGGTIQLESASGSVSAETSGGSIRLNQIAGEVSARTSGGRIRIGETGGAVEARTSGGSIGIDSAGGAVQAQTSGGSVEVGFVGQPGGDSELRTSGGSVTVYLRDDVQANLSASTSGGGVTSDIFDLTPENSPGRSSVNQSLNGGGPDLVLQSSGGSIRIRRRED